MLEIDPVGLVRGKGRGDGLLDQYVNDRPSAASSFLSVALNKAFRTAMNGVSSAREELADSELPLQAVVTLLPMRGGEHVVRQLFEPLGWRVELDVVPAPNGEATSKAYARLRLSGTGRVGALPNHLYVLIPVMDDAKHYWVGDEEIEKLLKRGEDWLDRHPTKELVVRRYLRPPRLSRARRWNGSRRRHRTIRSMPTTARAMRMRWRRRSASTIIAWRPWSRCCARPAPKPSRISDAVKASCCGVC